MDQIAELERHWHERIRFRRLHGAMTLTKDALVPGDTVLARRDSDGSLALDGRVRAIPEKRHGGMAG